MTDIDHWDELKLADRLRLVALEADTAGVGPRRLEAIHEAADRLDDLDDLDAAGGEGTR